MSHASAPGSAHAARADALVTPVTLRRGGIRLEPLTAEHAPQIDPAAADGELWTLFFTSVPEPGTAEAYIAGALGDPARFPFAVIDEATETLIGSTSYHDIVPTARRVEIGYTWYAKRVQRTHVNTTCKLMLLEHAFDALGCTVVGWRTDGENHNSQRAIAALGAKLDGTIRRHGLRRDGTIRDSVFFSMLAEEWPAAREHLGARLARHAA